MTGMMEGDRRRRNNTIHTLSLIQHGKLLMHLRIGREVGRVVYKTNASQHPGPNDPPANLKVAARQIRRHCIHPVVLKVLRDVQTGKHSHIPATLHIIGEGVVDVLSVVLGVGTIAPEHLHRLQHAAVTVAQEVSVDPPVDLPFDHRLVEEGSGEV